MSVSLLLKSFFSGVWELPTPKNISYLWGVGSLLALLMVVQIFSGVMLAFYFASGEMAWASVVSITRETNFGWSIRLVHTSMASFIFMVLFVHFFRGLVQSSFFLSFPWISGLLLKLLVMLTAFLGYVLPWGQMSFWGATVIINLISVFPGGKLLVIWLWGGFYVSSFTCSFFFTLHFLVPLLILVLIALHLFLLHFTGSTNSGQSMSGILKMKFTNAFSFKDLVNFIFIWIFCVFFLAYPDFFIDPVNFSLADMLSSPIHIQPEWYFLHFYAILRSIPNKMGGLLGFFMALIIIFFLSLAFSVQKTSMFKFYIFMVWLFLWVNISLMWLGTQPVEMPFIFMSQVLAWFYFSYFFIYMSIEFILSFLF